MAFSRACGHYAAMMSDQSKNKKQKHAAAAPPASPPSFIAKKQRRLRWCGIATGEKYHLNTSPDTTPSPATLTLLPSAPPPPAASSTPSSATRPPSRRRCTPLLATCVIFMLLLLLALLSHAFYTSAHNNDSDRKSNAPMTTTMTPSSAVEEDVEAVEVVVPLKQGPRPLHTADIIYDEMRTPALVPSAAPPLETGHFRDSVAEVFDPHPEYVIAAFGRTFVLELTLASDGATSTPQIIHLQRNRSRLVSGISSEPACDYVGRIRGEPHSFVRVSLCNGMTGYLKSTDGDFRIEPDEPYERDKHATSSIRHKMFRMARSEVYNGHHDHDALTTTTLNVAEHQEADEDDDDDDDEVRLRLLPDSIARHRRSTSYYKYQHHVAEDDDDDSFVSETYVIETLVVADRKMLEYHGNNRTRLTQYILTLMSHVALLFKDATVGNPMSLVVANILIVDDARVSFTSPTSTEFLRKFCDFQHRHSDQRHDVALLFTRDVICKSAAHDMCTTLGLAEVGSMCAPASSCAIVRDKGLSTSFTIAHELGHVLSMPHDDDAKCRRFQNASTPTNIMAKSLHNDTQPWHWSQCSKHYLTEFLNSPNAVCIQDGGGAMAGDPLRPGLPGKTFAADRQCELEFGPNSKVCSFMPECSTLWCTHDVAHGMAEELSGCQTQYMPWADGTPCENATKICLQGKCTKESSYRPVAGGWGAYTAVGVCSRSCGGGVQTFVRECNSPEPRDGGAYCAGGSRRYESCNTRDCPAGAPDFREVQCARFNGNAKGLKGLVAGRVRWVPKYGQQRAGDACKLYCRVDQSTAYYRLERKVLDGTECERGGFAICVNGACRAAGCDHVLGSRVQLDECGVCGGDNSTCRAIDGFYDDFAYGYNAVVTIPRGASNIDIRQRGASNGSEAQYLVLRDPAAGTYLLNGDSVISKYDKEVVFGGLKFHYSGGEASVERITTPRNDRLGKAVTVEVLQVGARASPHITYSYTLGTADGDPEYAWTRYARTECSAICSGRMGMLRCRSMATNDVVADAYCAHLARAPLAACNEHCRLEWAVGVRSACSTSCGPGVRTLSRHYCVKVTRSAYAEDQQRVNDKHCLSIAPPSTSEPCHTSPEERCKEADERVAQPRWRYDAWGACSTTCGSAGRQDRRAFCVNQLDDAFLDDHYCSAIERPLLTKVCYPEECPTWQYTEWTPCSATCGSGHRVRQAVCRRGDQTIPDEYCAMTALLATVEPCRNPECDFQWRTSDWSSCSTSCGRSGTQARQVQCVRDHNDEMAPDEHCVGERPINMTACRPPPPDCPQASLVTQKWKYEWHAGRFGKCSTRCGVGERTRDVTCIGIIERTRHKLVEQHCDHLTRKPSARKSCTRFDCAFAWIGGEWSSCSASCGRGTRRRQVSCFRVASPARRRRHHVTHPLLCPAVSLTNQTSPSQYCPLYSKPPVEEPCSVMRCDDAFHWRTSPWRACGQGGGGASRERRRVFCADAQRHRVADEKCLRLRHLAGKPRKQRPCTLHHCPADDEGEEEEEAMGTNSVVLPQSCRDVQLLNQSIGNSDYALRLLGRPAVVYCYKMDTERPEEFITLPAGEDNYAEYYGKSLPMLQHCPPVVTSNMLETRLSSVAHVERTTFWKVRLDVARLRILPSDFTFARHLRDGDNAQSFATAGDCYSTMRGCVRGRFRLNLTRTSFRLAAAVDWVSYGRSHAAGNTIRRTSRVVSGSCGGACGGCVPNSEVGLQLEVT